MYKSGLYNSIRSDSDSLTNSPRSIKPVASEPHIIPPSTTAEWQRQNPLSLHSMLPRTRSRRFGQWMRESGGLWSLLPHQPRYFSSTEPSEWGEKFASVSLVGLPNAGKSFLLNRLTSTRVSACHLLLNIGLRMHPQVSAVSKLRNTTRDRTQGVLTRGTRQLVFSDTPGLIDPK